MEVVAKRVKDFDDLNNPGEFLWSLGSDKSTPSRMLFVCPCGCGSHAGIAVKAESSGGPVWSWNGDLDHPTVTPSIRKLDGCEWHGFLTDGKFKSC